MSSQGWGPPTETDALLTDDEVEMGKKPELSDWMVEQIPLLLLYREDLFRQYHKLLDARMFHGNEGAALTIVAMLDLYGTTGSVPTKEAVEDRIRTKLTVNDDYEPVLAYLAKEMDPKNASVIIGGIKDWMQKSVRQSTNYDLIELPELSDEEYFEKADDILRLMRLARQPAGSRWSTTETITRPDSNDHKIPLPWPEINARLQGGLVPTETVGFIAPTQGGKSLLFGWLIAGFLKAGFNVLHVDVENEPYEAVIDIWNAIKQPSPGSFTSSTEAKEELGKFQRQPGHGRYFNTRPQETDYLGPDEIHDIGDSIEEQEGLEIDIVMIDGYDDLFDEELLKRHRNDEIAMKSRIIDKLRKYAKDKRRLTITSYQTNRQGLQAFSKGQDISMDMVQGSIRTIQRNTMVWTFTPNYDTKVSTIAVKKARRGQLNGCKIAANYHHTKTEDNDRGYYTQKEFIRSNAAQNEDAKESWSKSPQCQATRRMLETQDPIHVKGAALRESSKSNTKYRGHLYIAKADLETYIGPNTNAAVSDMLNKGWILDPDDYKKGLSIDGTTVVVWVFSDTIPDPETLLVTV